MDPSRRELLPSGRQNADKIQDQPLRDAQNGNVDNPLSRFLQRLRWLEPTVGRIDASDFVDSPLFLEEYRSLREESLRARQTQHTILQWSLGAIAVAFAAGLQFTRPVSARDDLVPFALIFGFVLPGGAFAASLAWLGEGLGMERVASYLRRRERATWRDQAADEPMNDAFLVTQPLAWENFIMLHAGERGRGKSIVGYVGGLGAFYGGTLSSLALFLVAVMHHRFLAHSHALRVAIISYACAEYLLYLVVGYRVGINILKLSKQVAGES